MKTNQKGFSLIEALLILIALSLIGGVGWYVLKARTSDDATVAESTSVTDADAVATSEFSSADPKFSFTYPEAWGDASIADGELIGPQEGAYKQVTFSEEKRVVINLVTSAYISPLDGCPEVVFAAKHDHIGRQASTVSWKSDAIQRLYLIEDAAQLQDASKTPGGSSAGWNEIKIEDDALQYTSIENDETTTKAGESCDGTITEAQADEVNAYFKFFHFVANFKTSKIQGVNAEFDGRDGDDETVRKQVMDVLNSIKES